MFAAGGAGANSGAGSNIVGSPMGIPISATQATHIDVTATDGIANNTVGQDIVWTPTDLKGNIDSSTSITIRKGDSLLLTDSEEGTALWIDTGLGGSPANFGGLQNDNFVCKFDVAGTYLITSTVTKADLSVVQHYLKVQVLSVNLDGPIACEVGYQREKDIFILGGTIADVVFTTNDSYILNVSVKQATALGAKLLITPLKRSSPVLLARLPGAFGPIINQQAIAAFITDLPAQAGIFVDGEGIGQSELFMSPLVSNVEFRFSMFAHSSTFLNGNLQFTVNTSAQASSLGEAGFIDGIDDTTNENGSVFAYTVEMPPDEVKYCFSVGAFQNGVRVSFDK